jgi:DivIVA domain-containing protein
LSAQGRYGQIIPAATGTRRGTYWATATIRSQVLEGVGTAIDAIVASALTRTKFPEGYDVDQVDDLLDQVIANLRA